MVRKVRAAADSTCEHKVLMPYSPHAPRNRPKETVSGGVMLQPSRQSMLQQTVAPVMHNSFLSCQCLTLRVHKKPSSMPGWTRISVPPAVCCLQLTNVIGMRYGVHPSTSTELYKGQSQLRLADADPESRKPWKTTNGVSCHDTGVSQP